VRVIALLWLLGQAASLSAFVPANCCESHIEERAAKDQQEHCHESAPAPEPEPGDACPMHSGGAEDRCVLTNVCEGPNAQLLSLFAYLGAIERPLVSEVTLTSGTAVISSSTPPLFRFTSPDAPPPKA
jgi:hypothetical protein